MSEENHVNKNNFNVEGRKTNTQISFLETFHSSYFKHLCERENLTIFHTDISIQ